MIPHIRDKHDLNRKFISNSMHVYKMARVHTWLHTENSSKIRFFLVKERNDDASNKILSYNL